VVFNSLAISLSISLTDLFLVNPIFEKINKAVIIINIFLLII